MFAKKTTIALALASLQAAVVGACVGDAPSENVAPSSSSDASSNAGDTGTDTDTPSPQDDASSHANDASVPDADRILKCPADGCKSCADLLALNAGLASGTYSIDPDGADAKFSAMNAYCDNETDGGGWTLVLNYVHADGTNPNLVERSTLPVLGNSTLGYDESASTTAWGHASLVLVDALTPKTIRFYGVTSAHDRIMSFKTNSSACISYAKTGEGSCAGIETAFAPLTGHTAHLPAEANAWMTNQDALALTAFPFYKTSTYHWSVKGGGSRWEIDSYSDSTSPAGKFNTIHRIFVR